MCKTERKNDNLTKVSKFKSNTNNLITHAEEYVRVAIKKKSNEPEWFEKQAITFHQYYGGFLHWFKNICGQNIEEYENLKKRNSHSYVGSIPLLDDILLEGYVAFFEIDSSMFETSYDKKLYIYYVHHQNKTEFSKKVEEMITFKNE